MDCSERRWSCPRQPPQLPVLLAKRIPLGVPEAPEASEVPTRGDDDLFISETMLSMIKRTAQKRPGTRIHWVFGPVATAK